LRRILRAEQRNDGYFEGGGEVHRARVAADEQVSAPQQADELLQVVRFRANRRLCVRAFRDDLEVALIQSPRFQYFNRERFRQILLENRLTLAQLAAPDAMKAAAAAGIDAFLGLEE
jgi:hypothetical protein